MDRKKFINQITGGLTLACVSCMMNACSKEDATNPTNNNNNNGNTNNPSTPNSSVLLTINLASQLLAVNDFISEAGVIVVRTAPGDQVSSFAAFSSACPHAGATVNFVKTSNSFNCAAHGSNFTISGSVINGPASTGLSRKTIEITGSTLTVK
jgi:cytochrome b6-f complex iron-sulfur subunit